MKHNFLSLLRTSASKTCRTAATLAQPNGQKLFAPVALALVLGFAESADAQITPSVRFTTGQLRATVGLNTTNSIVITNLINVSTDIVSAVTFNVSGLPSGASATLTDTNGNALTSTSIDTNLWLTLNLTNIAEGTYLFYLNADGGATNRLPLVLQAAHVWNGANGALEVSNLVWSAATNWLGGVPGAASDVVFTDIGAQTNADAGGGFPFTNSIVDVSTTLSSLRFAQIGFTNLIATSTNTGARPSFHTLRLNPGVALTITGSNSFSLLRDYIGEDYGSPRFGVNFLGGAGSRLVVSNETSNLGYLVDGNNAVPSLNLTNLDTFIANLSRMGIGEYQLYPNYRAINDAFNQGRDTNQASSTPQRFPAAILLARTNIIKAVYKDPENYTNENTRGYAISFLNGERSGTGALPTRFVLGASNAFLADSVCFVGAGHSSIPNDANNPLNRGIVFGTNNATAIFRSTNGLRLSMFAMGDDGGTNQGSGNVKSSVDFSLLNGFADILADRLYLSRDRTSIRSNENPTAESTLTLGRGTIDVNSAILGFQEHSNKIDWTSLYGAQAYRGYCQGTLNVTNGGTFKVNGNLILGYTADNNPESAAQQFNTRGQINIFSNSTVTASNILVDTGLNFTSILNPRQNNITINASGILTVTNGMGVAPGLPVDNLNIAAGGILTVFPGPGKTNIIVKNLTSSGATPGIIKIAALPAFPSYPTNVPIISYQAANPFFAADMSAIGGTVQGYIVNNSDNKTIDLFLTTNAPKSLIWSGNINGNWDLTTKNWLTTNGISTNFTFGDIATFDDSTTVNSITVADVVVPNQATNGVIFNNNTRSYTFASASGGAIAGTAKLVKQGLGNVTFNSVESGPITVAAGVLNGAGIMGAVTVYSNATLSLDTFGTINGGVTSTGTVAIAVNSSIASGPVNIRGGTFRNQGLVNASGSMSINGGALVTNEANAEIDVDTGATGGNWVASGGSVIANRGIIKEIRGRLNLASGTPFDGATLFGEGQFLDSDGGLVTGNDGRLVINPSGLWSPGTNLYNSIGNSFVQARIDLNNTPASGVGVLRIEVDFNNPQTNDIVVADKWNNITGMILMTNINPGAGSFGLGQTFQVFSNTASSPGSPFPNFIDVNGSYPIMSPVVPAPGLQWGLADFRTYGSVTVTNAGLVWDGGIDGNWDTNTANWKSGKVYSDNKGVMLDDSASGTTTITLTNFVAPIGFILVTNIVPNVSTNIITNNPVMSPGLVVSNSAKDYTIIGTTNGKISGMTGLYKIGSGTLNLLNPINDFIGNVIINGGTVVVTNTPPSTSILTLGINGSGGLNNEIFMDGGTLKYVGNTNATLPRAMSVGSGGATLNVNSTTNELTPGTIWGAGGLTKTGLGQLGLTANANSYTNGTTISQGTLRLANSALGFGGVTFAGGTTLIMTNAFNFTNPINIAGAGVTWQLGATNVLGGGWTGNGTVNTIGTNLAQLILNGSMSAFSGSISLGSTTNSIRFNNSTNSNPNTGSTSANFDLGTGAGYLHNLNGAGLNYDLGSLSGGANTVLFGSSTNMGSSACSYSIGANGSNTVFSGRITNGVGAVSIAKVGSGSLTLAGNSTYSGGTTVSGGTLLVNNTAGSGTGSGAVSVGSSGKLGGNGTISGAVSVAAGGTLSPGTSIGKLTINNSLSLAASSTTIVEVSKSGSVLTNDNVAGLTSVSFNGSLVVSNIGPDALVAGNSFQLFNIGGTGNFASITPALPSPQSWSFNPANGVLTVVDPRVITYSRSGNSITFSWSGTSKLQAQTNTITGTWHDYPGGGTSPVTVTVDPNQTDVFFRLVPGP